MINQQRNNEIKERLVALTRDLILMPSIPSRMDDLKKCFEFIKNHLESLNHIEIRTFQENGVPSLVAAPVDCHNPKILLCGHLDVITHPDMASYSSKIEDGRIYGPGAGDMKGAVAILLEVFRYIHNQQEGIPLGIAITADEETGGQYGIGHLFKNVGMRCSQAMIPDGGSIDEITIEEKGILHLTAQCEGKSSHAARPWLGNNPIEHLLERLTALRAHFAALKTDQGYWYPTCSVTIIETENQTVNRIATNAKVTLDIRFPPPHQVDQVMGEVKKILGDQIHLQVLISAEPTHLSPDDLYKTITEEVIGRPVKYIKDDGGSDARYIAAYGIPVIMSRPIVGNLHSVDEWIDIDSMVSFYHIYEQYLKKRLIEG